MATRATSRNIATPRRVLVGAACIGALMASTAGAGAQDPSVLGASYEKVIAPAAVLSTKTTEAPRPLQSRAVRSMRASRALLGTINATAPGVYPSCAVSLARLRAGASRMSQGASLVRSAPRLRGPARRARVMTGRTRIRAGALVVESGLALAGACRAELNAQFAPPVPVPGGGPGGTGPPIFDFL